MTPIYPRFETPAQRRNRETLLREWMLRTLAEDRLETALPPVELWEIAGRG